MPTTAQAAAQPAPDQLDFYSLRDDLARTYAPANAHERMLTTQIAQSWLRLQKALEIERGYFEKNNALEVLGSNLDQFKAVTRFTTDCERAWRHAVENLERVQRRREKAGAAAHFAASTSASLASTSTAIRPLRPHPGGSPAAPPHIEDSPRLPVNAPSVSAAGS